MPMKNPPHPGGFVLRQCIEPLGLSITDAAMQPPPGVTRTTLSELVSEKRGRKAVQGPWRQRRKLACATGAV
jgi:plasmid maintenance system antidote protein VapI